jgi:hypothetical protein
LQAYDKKNIGTLAGLGEEEHWNINRLMTRGTSAHQQAKDARTQAHQQEKQLRDTGTSVRKREPLPSTPTSRGLEGDRHTSSLTTRGTLEYLQAKDKMNTSTQAGQGLEGHRNTSRSGRTDQRGKEKRDTGTSADRSLEGHKNTSWQNKEGHQHTCKERRGPRTTFTLAHQEAKD